MEIIKEGHVYGLELLDPLPGTSAKERQRLEFRCRSSEAIDYGPGESNGTNVQEVMRAIIQRCRYLHAVIPCDETANAIYHARMVLYEFEVRAFRRKMQKLNKRSGLHEESALNAHRDGYKDVPFTERFIEMRPVGEDGHILLSADEKEWIERNYRRA